MCWGEMMGIRTALLVSSLIILFPYEQAAAQDWPTRPIQIVVASGAGGSADIIARIIAEKLAPVLGQPVVIENRPGAGGNTGAGWVARANADGYTLLMSGSPTHSVGPHLFKNLSYHAMRDVPPVAMVAVAPNLLVVDAGSPIMSVSDLINLAREKPGIVTFSSGGIGTTGHLAGELLKATASVKMLHVPYKDGTQGAMGVLTGDVTFTFFTLPSLLPLIEAGKLRAIAFTSAERVKLMPDVPTVAESGFPGFEVVAWYALFAPRGTPDAVVTKLSRQIETIVNSDDFRDQMAKLGTEPKYMSPQQVIDYVANESPKWGALLKDIGAPLN
jgi:tripartite-type tricarboxylate transporter receptor subunit TctC